MFQRVTTTGGLGDQLGITAIAKYYRHATGKQLIVQSNIASLLEENPDISISNEIGDIVLQATTDISMSNQVFYAKQMGFAFEHSSPVVYIRKEEMDWAINIAGPKYVVMTARAGWPSREWSVDKFAEVTEFLQKQGYKVIEIGKTLPNFYSEAKNNKIPNVDIDLIDKTTLREVAALLRGSAFYVGVNTVALHIAEAVNCNQIVPLCDNGSINNLYPNTLAVYPKSKCSVSCREKCSSFDCSLDSITASEIIDKIKEYLKNG